MSEYLILAEAVIYKKQRLTFINTINNFKAVAMPAKFNFDMVVLCGPKWKKGEHKLSLKLTADNGKEINLGNTVVNIPHEDFVYNAFLNDIKIQLDYSVSDLTFHVYDDNKEIITKKYPVLSMLVPSKKTNAKSSPASSEVKRKATKVKKTENNDLKTANRFGTPDNLKISAFYNLKTEQDIEEALRFLEKLSDNLSMKSILVKRVEKQLKKMKEKEAK